MEEHKATKKQTENMKKFMKSSKSALELWNKEMPEDFTPLKEEIY